MAEFFVKRPIVAMVMSIIIVILGALALMKVPVAAFEVEGIREVIEHDVSGVIVPQYDVVALHDGAKKILSSPALSSAFAQRAFDHVHNEWDAVKMGADIKEIYEHAQKEVMK